MKALMTILVLLMLMAPAALAEDLELKLFVDATLGVSAEVEDEPIVLKLGETGGTTLTIINDANIRDKIRINGRVRQNNVPTDWVKLAFICGETVGKCDDVPSSDTRTVDDIELTPEIRETTVFVEMTGWKRYTSGDQLFLHIDGFSLTNNTVQADLNKIPIIIESENGGGPLSSPGLTNISLLILLLSAGTVAFLRKDVIR